MSSPSAVVEREYRMCGRCVMDTTDPDISFDEHGVCNHCRDFDDLVAWRLPEPAEARRALEQLVERIKRAGHKRDYDCVIGVSGGVDSSYVAYQAKELGLRPLAVHLDNGWDSELAVQNIQNLVSKLGFDLYTHVVDWDEFRDIQRAFLLANVVDIEMISDHAINSVLYHAARQEKVGYVLSGANVATEAVLPAAWVHRKADLRNLKAIQKRFGTRKIDTLPVASSLRLQLGQLTGRVRWEYLLNYLDYDKKKAIATLEEELDWTNYGGKHYESMFTRFYQGYILPKKFGIDKRRAHLSALICSGQMSRDEALDELGKEIYDPRLLESDKRYVAKKLGWSVEEFDALMQQAPRAHAEFPSDEVYVRPLMNLKKFGRRMTRGART